MSPRFSCLFRRKISEPLSAGKFLHSSARVPRPRARVTAVLQAHRGQTSKLIPLYFSYLPACFRQPFPLHAQHPPPPHDRGYHARARRGQHEEGLEEQAASRSGRGELTIGCEAVTDRRGSGMKNTSPTLHTHTHTHTHTHPSPWHHQQQQCCVFCFSVLFCFVLFFSFLFCITVNLKQLHVENDAFVTTRYLI